MTLYRPRRLRTTQTVRDLVSETAIMPSRLIMPHFVREGSAVREAIETMPGIERVCLDNLLRDVEADLALGIRSLLLFGIPDEKDETGSGAWNGNGIVQRAVTAIKKRFPEICVITDVCLCEYTSHGHCGVVHAGTVLNDPTLELLAKTALSHAAAGADMVAPSGHDGRPRRRHPRRPGRGWLQRYCHHGLCGKICFGLLRPFQGCCRQHPAVRRPKELSDGLPQRP